MLVDVVYSKEENEHFGIGDIITLKPGGSSWGVGEIGVNVGLVTLEVTPELFDALQANLGAYKVDSVENPQAVIPGA